MDEYGCDSQCREEASREDEPGSLKRNTQADRQGCDKGRAGRRAEDGH